MVEHNVGKRIKYCGPGIFTADTIPDAHSDYEPFIALDSLKKRFGV